MVCDADYAGCKRTRKSTTGVALFLGGHWIIASSKNQSLIARSSGESEYYGILTDITMGLGVESILKNFGKEVEVVVILMLQL